MSDDDYPLGAVILSIVSGLFILFDAGILLVASSVLPAGLPATGLLSGLGILGGLFGLAILLLGVYLVRNSDTHVGVGIVILLLSLASLITGGGFVIGTILGVIGGILAIIYDADEDAMPLPEFAGSTASSSAPRLRSSCPSCGFPRGASDFRMFCTNCGASLA